MRRVAAVLRREWCAWCDAPGNWVVAALFALALHALYCFIGFPLGRQSSPGLWEARLASLHALWAWLPLMYALLVPALCMGAWAEERRAGTDELLRALPISSGEAVLGKFLACFLQLALIVSAAVLPLALLVDWLGPLDRGAALGGWLGALALGASSIGIALCCSALTGEQLSAFLLAALALGALWASALFTRALPPGLAELVSDLSPPLHYLESAARGLFDATDLVFHALLTAACLWINALAVEGQRWR